jgi:hypothetical protein
MKLYSAAMAAITLLPMAGLSAQTSLTTLQPGAKREIKQEIPVNVVFLGFSQAQPGISDPMAVNPTDFLAKLPKTYDVQSRYKFYYGLPSDLGLKYQYKYNVVFAPAAFETSFFQFLTSRLSPFGLNSPLAQIYNAQTKRKPLPPITSTRLIDANAVERWLGTNASQIGVNTAQYTIFFINWYGKPDFRHHVYTKGNEVDPDTGFAFGATWAGVTSAWGGTAANDKVDGTGVARRVWFYDLSAGPDIFMYNFIVDTADVDGNGKADYRIPPIWEYGNLNAYRPFNDLTGDLSKLARYVAIDCLFTTSPLYKPAISAPELPRAMQLDMNMFTESGAKPAGLKPEIVTDVLSRLQPLHPLTSQVNSYPLTGQTAEVLSCFALDQRSCYGGRLFNIPFGDLFLYFGDHLNQYIDGDGDYEIPIFGFNTTSARYSAGGLLGFADDNWRDGTQTYVFAFIADNLRDLFGFTTTIAHEAGHHLGLSHPHDGHDSEQKLDFGAADDFFFVWAGDESSTIMNYTYLNADFSQFDQDNMNRYLTSAYLNQANQVLAKIVASPRASQVQGAITTADATATEALTAFQASDWGSAAAKAASAYRGLLTAAASINVKIEPQAWQADYRSKGRSPKFVDTVPFRFRQALQPLE